MKSTNRFAMNNAPIVYVPIEPESNGLKLPLLLSVLAHGVVIGILLYTYQLPTLDTEGRIETVMVSPEQLAQMQGQILANRAAASAAQANGGETTYEATNSDTPQVGATNAPIQTEPTSVQVPVFIHSEETSDEPLLMSETHQQRLKSQAQAYQDNLEQWSAEQDDIALDRLERVEETKQSRLSENRETLKSFQDKQNNPPKIEKPNNTQRNIDITAGSSGSSKNLSLSADGQSTLAGDSATTSINKGNSRSAASGSRGTSNSEIISRIKRNYNPPIAAKGATQRATLTITVNSSGDVVSVTASGSDAAVNEAARQAVLATGNFPINTDDPKYPTFSVQFNGSS